MTAPKKKPTKTAAELAAATAANDVLNAAPVTPAPGDMGTGQAGAGAGDMGTGMSGAGTAWGGAASPMPNSETPAPIGPATPTTLDKLNKGLVATGSQPIPQSPGDLIRALLTAAGVDMTSQEVLHNVQLFLPYIANLPDNQKQAVVDTFVAGQLKAHPAPVAPGAADYNQAVSTYGFGSGFADYTATQVGLGGIPHTAAAVKHLPNFKIDAQEYVINPDNGAILFKNGVIFDPSASGAGAQSLIYPNGDPSVAGSGSWMHSVTLWSSAKIQEWRTKLGEQGYLAADQALNGSGTADSAFLVAIKNYQDARYSNYGTPIADHSVDLSKYGPQGNIITDLNKNRGYISSQVRSQYRTTFGQDPSKGELQSWTDFVVSTGMQLQRQGGLDPGTAESEALARFGNKAQGSPQAGYIQDQQTENTSLHDALSGAVSAYASIT